MSSTLLDFSTEIMVMTLIVSFLLLFFGIGVLVLIHVCIVGRVFRRSLSITERGERLNDGNRGLSLDDLQRLPCYDFKAGEKGSSPMVCVICLESFQLGERCMLLPVCKHTFHAHCVDSWLLKTPVCPICRTSAAQIKSGKVSMDRRSPFTGGAGSELRESHLDSVVGFPVSDNPYPLHGANLSPCHASTSG